MSKVILPYTLKEGQVAYASRVMANLNALLDKLNGVTLPGMEKSDMEQALRQLKLLLDRQQDLRGRDISAFAYDSEEGCMTITLADGAVYKVDMSPFLNAYTGSGEGDITITVDGDDCISGRINDGAVTGGMLHADIRATLEGKLDADEIGNADGIVFADGESLQDKLDNGSLKGADAVAVALDSFYCFRLGDNGHLYISVADDSEAAPFSLDENGHLIYTID